MLIIGAGALVVGLTIYALLDAVRTPAREERTLPKWLWVLVTLFFPVVGPVLWLLLGRPKRERGAHGSISLPGAAQRGNTPSMASPDDDEAYLRWLKAKAERERASREAERASREAGTDGHEDSNPEHKRSENEGTEGERPEDDPSR